MGEDLGNAFASLFGNDEDDFEGGPFVPSYGAPGGSLSSDMALPAQPRADCNFVGLHNQGATCYLNSFLQSLFMSPELRQALYDATPEELDAAVDLEVQAAEARAAAEAEAAAKAAEEAAKASEEAGEEPPPAASAEAPAPVAADPPAARPRTRVLILELIRLFSELQLLERRATETVRFTRRAFGWHGDEHLHQHDVQELLTKLLQNMHSSLAHTSQRDLVPRLYRGKTASQRQCLQCRTIREDVEPIFSLFCEVQGHKDLVSSFASATFFESMTGDNAVECPTCDMKTDTRKGYKWRTLPPVLVTNLNRFCFDMASLSRVKVTDKFEFPLVLDVAPFLEGGTLDVLRGTATPDGTCADDDTVAASLDELRSNMVWVSQLATEEGRAKARTVSDALSSRGDLEHIYDLCAVMVHSGGAHGGHYHAFVRDTTGQGTWVAPSDAVADKPKTKGGNKAPVETLATAGDGSPLPVLVRVLARQPLHPVHRLPYCAIDTLGSEIATELRSGWKHHYKRKYGGMKDYIRKQDKYFRIHGNVVLLVDSSPLVPDADAAPAPAPADDKPMTDEEYARKLASEWGSAPPAATPAPAPAPAADDGGEWTTVGGAKAGSGDAPPSAGAPAAAEGASGDEPQAPPDTAKTRNMTLNAAIAADWGYWYDFNDTCVEPVAVTTLRRTFEGSECGYILVYRSRALPGTDPANPFVPALDPTAFPLRPSPLWQDLVAQTNAGDEAHRQEYDTKSHQFEVTVHGPSMYAVDGLQLRKAREEGAATLVLDDRDSWGSFKDKVAEFLTPTDVAVPPKDAMHFHVVRPRGESGLHLYEEVGAKFGVAGGAGGSDGADAAVPTDSSAMDALNLEEFKPELCHGVTLLVWNGASLHGEVVPVGEAAEPLTLHVSFLTSTTERALHVIVVPKTTTLFELKVAIVEAAGLQRSTLIDVYQFGNASRGRQRAVKVGDKKTKAMLPAPLPELGFKDGMEVMAETTKDPATKQPRRRALAFEEVLRREKVISVKVVDTRGGEDGVMVEFEVERGTSLATVKGLFFSKLGLSAEAVEGGGRFRKTDSGGPGNLVEDETDSVQAAGLRDGETLRFEEGVPLGGGDIAVNYHVYSGNSTTARGGGGEVIAAGEVHVRANLSVGTLKQRIIEAAGVDKDAALCRIRSTNWCGEGAGVCGAEHASLTKEGIANGVLVWLEDGVVLKKGMVALQFAAWVPEVAARAIADLPPGALPTVEGVPVGGVEPPAAASGGGLMGFVSAAAGAVSSVLGGSAPAGEGDEGDGAKAGAAPDDEPPPDALDHMLRVRRACLLPLEDLTLPDTTTVAALKQQLLLSSGLAAARAYALRGGAGEPPETATNTPGGDTLASFGLTPAHLRLRELGANNVPTRVIKGDGSKTLKASHMMGGKTFVVEVLDAPEALPQESLVLWLQRRYPNAGTVGAGVGCDVVTHEAALEQDRTIHALCGVNTPFWPPRCVVWRCSPKPTFQELAEVLSGEMGIPVDRVRVAKLFQTKKNPQKWTPLKAVVPGATRSRRKPARRNRGRPTGPPSVLHAPYLLKDGNLLAVGDADQDPAAKDDWVRVEDYCLQVRADKRSEAIRAQRAANRASGGGGSRGGSRAVEVGLTFGVDYEFPDSSSGSESEVDE